MKVYSDAALAALEKGEAIVTGALAIYCDPPVFVWGGPWTIEIDGNQYLGIDDRGVGQVTGGAIGGDEQAVTLTLSGIEPEVMDLLEAESLKQAPAKLYRMLFDGSGGQLLDCRVIKRGKIDDVMTEEVQGGTGSVQVSIESAARGLGRSGKRMRTDADQRMLDPADGFFKHTAYAGTKTIYFGGKPTSARVAVS